MAHRKPKLLCIDDDAQGLIVRKHLLEVYGFEVTTCTSPRQGLRLFQFRDDVDLAVVDFNMPDMDGVTLAGEMKRVRPDVPVVVLSALPWLPEHTPKTYDLFLTKMESGLEISKRLTALLESRPAHGTKRRRTPLIRKSSALAGVLAGVVVESAARHLLFGRRKPHRTMTYNGVAS